ncbi:hypothetical protein [Methylobacterium flocculans]|uniref:hypothetical protein n=1 Tax=Methylobacterium flocculans TaxID=2984843 RepID=UPI0021F32042|nr:hypothetical protein [Methylobacterium sp. FF17]
MAETFEPWPQALDWVLQELKANQVPNKAVPQQEEGPPHLRTMPTTSTHEATVLLSDEDMRLVMNMPSVFRANLPWKDDEYVAEFTHSGGLQTPYVTQAVVDTSGTERYNVRIAL